MVIVQNYFILLMLRVIYNIRHSYVAFSVLTYFSSLFFLNGHV